jgi:hypothetical protein
MIVAKTCNLEVPAPRVVYKEIGQLHSVHLPEENTRILVCHFGQGTPDSIALTYKPACPPPPSK